MNTDALQALEQMIANKVPGFELKFKDEVHYQRWITWLLRPVNPAYGTEYATTLGRTVYFPSRTTYVANPARSFSILAHEFVHLCDGMKHPRWMAFSYLLPQALSLPVMALSLLVLCFTTWGWIGVLLGAALLGPWPSMMREYWEYRGYLMTYAIYIWRTGSIPDSTREFIAKNFWGFAYYRMTWGKGRARNLVTRMGEEVRTGQVLSGPAYAAVYQLMHQLGLSHELPNTHVG